jgi:hypothetical protein
MGRIPAGDGSGGEKAVLRRRPLTRQSQLIVQFLLVFPRYRLRQHTDHHEILLRWLKDHPGEKTVPARIKGNLSNVKSVLRKKRRKKPGRKPGVATPAGGVVAVAIEPARISIKGFEKLEEQIDDCLTAARGLQNEALAGVIGLLRRARNEVVWKLGQ